MRRSRGVVRALGASLVAVVALSGCATAFTGSARVPGGAAGCRDVCHSYGMELAGMVAMGEYSDGCICRVNSPQQAASKDSTELAVAGAAPAAVGVVMAMRQREQAQQTQQMTMHPMP